MKKLRKSKKMAAGLLAGIALAASLVLVVSSVTAVKPTLSFEGLAFEVMENGSIQASVDVCVEKVDKAAGAYFLIAYNGDDLTPSDKGTNEMLPPAPMVKNERYFALSKDLYGTDDKGEPLNPFKSNPTGVANDQLGFCAVDTQSQQIYIRCEMDHERLWAEIGETGKGKITRLPGVGEDSEDRYYFGTTGKKTVIGTMTFLVEADKIPDIVMRFKNPANIATGDFLLKEVTTEDGTSTWNLPYLTNDGGQSNYNSGNADIKFNYTFSKTLISVAAAAPSVKVNAWQAYQTGGIEDIAATLRTHSPMVTAKYSTDRAAENFILPWGEKNTTEPLREYNYKVYLYDEAGPGHKGAEVTAYTPTGGKYVVEQYFYHVAEGETEAKRFPLPVTVELTVSPIKMTGVTADRLEETYRLADAISTYSTYDSLELPNQARLMTDVLPGGATLSMPILGWSPGYTADMTSLKNATGGSWPILVTDEAGIGTYTFQPTDGVGAVAPAFTGAEVSARYPWLTVDTAATEAIDKLTATRTIVGDTYVVDAAEYKVLARHSATESGTMELVVERKDKVMADGAAFKVLLPSGQGILSGWFTAENGGAYSWEKTGLFYTGIVTPGAQDGVEAANRELVRRAINLGGWFSVSVQEAGIGQPSNFIPVYLAPRTNLYTESKTYHFTGGNAGLLSSVGLPGTTVTMPRGSYSFENAAGAIQTETYGVTTTYDGVTGGEPGSLHTFTVAGDAWNPSGPIYGPNEFKSVKYGGYGRVDNATTPVKTAGIRTDKAPPALPIGGKLELTYEGEGTVTTGVDNRLLAVYDTKQVGYTYRQEYRFTLTNTGTAAVSNIWVDPRLAHFQVLGDGPAASLAPGSSTTFVLTYAFDLKANALKEFYFDTIDVNSDDGGTLNFDAKFRVSAGPVRRVTVVTLPELTAPQSMGTAVLIAGETDTMPKSMDYTVSDPNYEETATFWLSAVPTDEYLVKRVYYYERNNKSGTEVSLTQYDPGMAGSAPLKEGTDVYFGEMPGYNVTVYVEFYEPVSSKLRLSALVDFAAGTEAELKPVPPVDPPPPLPPPQKLWQKAFTDDEAKEDDEVKLKLGKVDPSKPDFDSRVNQYLVVIPATASFSQVEVTLRKVDIHYKLPDGTEGNPDINPRVLIELVGGGPDGGDLTLYDNLGKEESAATSPPHTSEIFDSPAEKMSAYVRLTLSANETIGETTNLIYRHYYLEIVRDTTEEVGTPGYGNSPYGMIMKATNITAADKTKAKEAFVDGGYKFDPTYTPTGAAALKNTYWPEAWGGAIAAEAGNRDLDELAFFALLGQKCVLPGVTEVKDSSGRAVAPKDIKRTATVTLKDGNEITLDLKTAADTGALDWQAISDSATEKYAVAPGAYTLRYTYVDYDGKTEGTFTRPFLVLGAVGDLNADGGVVKTRGAAGSDLDVLQNRFAAPIPYAADNPAFRLRSCDVNNDRSINNIDGNALQYVGAISGFYLPQGY